MNIDDLDDLSTWTMEALRNYEEHLYDQECAGEDTWFERDKVLWELSRREKPTRHELDKVKDMKTWPDEIRKRHCTKEERG